MKTLRQLLMLPLLLPVLTLAAGNAERQFAGSESATPGLGISAFHLRGVLVSDGGRSALVNGEISREGDWVAGLQILEIHEDGVRVRAGGDELNVPIGARAESGAVRRSNIMITRNRAVAPPQDALPADSTDVEVSLAETPPAGRQRRVRPGETLGVIAADYVSEGLSLDQVMASVFSANENAFGGNMNVLFAGALLDIPPAEQLHGRAAAAASAEVDAHMQRWRADRSTPVEVASASTAPGYRTVQPGDTLSAIAVQLDLDGVTQEQAMMALYAANPNAFAGNINRLMAGKTLVIPAEPALSLEPPDTAAREVQRHWELWNQRREPAATVAGDSAHDPPWPDNESLARLVR